MAYDGTSAAAPRPATEDTRSAVDYAGILWRRRWYVIIPAVVLLTIAMLVAFLLPPVYRSFATILIEEPDVPRELVLSTITGFADERIQVITQRVMATQNLAAIIDRYGLYTKARARLPLNEVVDGMRQDIKTELISADVKDPRSGKATQATIAFKVSFEYGDSQTAQRVANELVSLYLSENLRERQNKAAETANFLQGEADRLQKLISDLEGRIADFKLQYAGSLPEQMDYNLALVGRSESELRELTTRAQGLDQQRVYLEAELAKISPYGSYIVDGQRVMGPSDQLKASRTQLITLSGQYGPDHPDVVKLRRQVDALEKQTGSSDDPQMLQRERDRLQTELAQAKERYSDAHPDVARLKRNLEAVEKALASAQRRPRASTVSAAQPDNPAYIQLQAQLQATRNDLRSIADQQQKVKAQITDVEKRVMQTPVVEREYAQLNRDYQTAQQEYHEIRNKQMLAQLGETLETERKGERFSLIEPPIASARPIKPNRVAILALGFVLSIGTGIGTAVIAENLDKAVFSAGQLASITGTAPLVVVPYLRTRRERQRTWRVRIATAAAIIAALVLALVLVHVLVMPLDVLSSTLQRRIETTLIRVGD